MIGYENQPINWAPATCYADDTGQAWESVQFIVPGKPEPQGDLASGRAGKLYHKNKALRPWRDVVHDQGVAAMAGHWRIRHQPQGPGAIPLFERAVEVSIEFVLKRPVSYPKTRTPDAVKKPDTDKLTRAILDALTGVVWQDDSQVVRFRDIHKRTAELGETPGCVVQIWGKR